MACVFIRCSHLVCVVILRCINSVNSSFAGFFFFQAEDGIRDLVRSRGLGDVYKRQLQERLEEIGMSQTDFADRIGRTKKFVNEIVKGKAPILSLIHI